ncbi:MAG TPA: beta-galactosidase [Cytophagaceae bacterium]|jgi:hypothetical protein
MFPIKQILLGLISACCCLVIASAQSYSQVPLNGKIEQLKGRPTIFINNVPTYPMIYALTDLPGGRLTFEEMPQHNIERFCQAGIKMFYFCLFLDQMWSEDGNFDITIAQKQIRGVLEVCPDAAIVIRLHMHSPKWWLDKHPEEAVSYGSGPALADGKGRFMRSQHDDPIRPLRYSMASEIWRKDVTEKTTLFCKMLSSVKEGNAVVGMQIGAGVYGEWHNWGSEPDISVPMNNYFKKWIRSKYANINDLKKAWGNDKIEFGQVKVPIDHDHSMSKGGVFRDPNSERNVIDYYESHHQLVADNIIHFCRTVKENWPRPIITGTFYGYVFSLFGRETAIGHLEVDRILKSPYVDYLSGPQAYYPDAEKEGDPARSRGLLKSCQLHKKLWLDEYDTQPNLTKITDPGFDTTQPVYHKTIQAAQGIVRRNILSSAIKGMGLWFFDFGVAGGRQYTELKDNGSNGWWDYPFILDDIKKLKVALEKNRTREYKSEADVLMVYDTKVYYHLSTDPKYTHVSNVAVNWNSLAVWKSGVGFDAIYLQDLEKIDLDQYKVVVFNNTFTINPSQKLFIDKNVKSQKRNIIWFYAPGYSDGNDLDTKRISSLTDIKIEGLELANPEVSVTGLTTDAFSYKTSDTEIRPLFFVADSKVQSYGHFLSTDKIAIAKKKFKDHVSWYVALPSYDHSLLAGLLKQAGAHVYTESGDIIYAGDGLLGIHSKRGGEREIKLKSGKKIIVNLPTGTSTTILDSESGEVFY